MQLRPFARSRLHPNAVGLSPPELVWQIISLISIKFNGFEMK